MSCIVWLNTHIISNKWELKHFLVFFMINIFFLMLWEDKKELVSYKWNKKKIEDWPQAASGLERKSSAEVPETWCWPWRCYHGSPFDHTSMLSTLSEALFYLPPVHHQNASLCHLLPAPVDVGPWQALGLLNAMIPSWVGSMRESADHSWALTHIPRKDFGPDTKSPGLRYVFFAVVPENSDIGYSSFSEDVYNLQMSRGNFVLDKGHQLTENGTTLGLQGENTFCKGLFLGPCRPFGRFPSDTVFCLFVCLKICQLELFHFCRKIQCWQKGLRMKEQETLSTQYWMSYLK